MGSKTLAVDIGRTGDRTVLVFISGSVVSEILTLPNDGDLMVSVGRIQLEAEKRGILPRVDPEPFTHLGQDARGRIIVDATGIGAGVYDRLTELGFRTVEFIAGGSPRNKDRFLNRRAEVAWAVRTGLEKGTLALPDDDELWDELQAISWKPNSAGRIQLEAKKDLKSRIGRSPDKADAVAMAVGETPTATLGGELATF